MSAYSLDGTSHLGLLQLFDFESDGREEDGRGLATAYEFNQLVSVGTSHRFEILQDGSGQRSTALDVSVFNLGGSSLLASLAGGSIRVRNDTDEGAAVNDLFDYPNAVGSGLEVNTRRLIPAADLSIAIMSDALSTTIADRHKTVNFTIGSVQFGCAMLMNNVKHSVKRGSVQEYSARFSARGTPSNPTGSTIYGVAFTGDGLLTLSADTKAGTYNCTGLITELEITFDRGQIVKNSGTILIQGQPTYAAST